MKVGRCGAFSAAVCAAAIRTGAAEETIAGRGRG